MPITDLASYRDAVARIRERWPAFLAKRGQRLAEQVRNGHAAERATECILEDLFTEVLDWTAADLNHQVQFADLMLSRLSVKWLIVEAKRPGALAWNAQAVQRAMDQACRYAAEQHVRCVAVSDGQMLYAADVGNGGLLDRVFVSLTSAEAPDALWWLDVHGIYRPLEASGDPEMWLPAIPEETTTAPAEAPPELLHQKYHLPARCFAYVGNAADQTTWKLPYRESGGRPDSRRLPKAIQSILSNYRGERVRGIPDGAVEDVLLRLKEAASELGKLPSQTANSAPAYANLIAALEQFGEPGTTEPSGSSGCVR